MISSPCSAEQAQRTKLCPRKSPPQSFPPIAQQAPGHFVRGLCCSRAAQPAAEAAGARPASNKIHAESPRTFRPGASPALHPKPAAQQVTHSCGGARGGKARLESNRPPPKGLLFKAFRRSGRTGNTGAAANKKISGVRLRRFFVDAVVYSAVLSFLAGAATGSATGAATGAAAAAA